MDQTAAMPGKISQRAKALIKILLCLVVYAAVLVETIDLTTAHRISIRSGVGFALTFTFVLFFITLFTTFKPFKK